MLHRFEFVSKDSMNPSSLNATHSHYFNFEKTFSPEISEMTINSYYLENESQNVQTHS